MTNTMMVVTVVSLRVGHVTFCTSARTSCKNLNGLTFAIALSNSRSPPKLKDEPAGGSFSGIRFVAEVRHRAADDGCYLLPVRCIVKRDRTREHDPEKWEPVFRKDHAPSTC